MERVLIAGCGYVGSALAARLAADGHSVWGMRRNPAALPGGVLPFAADLRDAATLRGLPDGLTTVFYTAAADGGSDDEYRAAYLDGPRNLLAALVEQAARVLGPAYDVEVVEAHHRRKVDAPSGTALELGRAAARGHGVELDSMRRDGRSGHPGARPAGEIGFHAVRGGDVVGEHRVMFLGDRERLELVHLAQDRALFAEGALRAARWMAGKPAGVYTMRDVLGLG